MFIWSRDNPSVKQVKFSKPKYENFECVVRIARIKTSGGAVINILEKGN
jgi:hypothetical protein